MKTMAFLGASALAAGSIALSGTFAPAQAATFSFGCDPALGTANCAGDEGGTLDISSTSDSGSFLYTVKVDNTSAEAGITGIGFDFLPDFDLTKLVSNSLSVIRKDGTDITSSWAISPGTSNVSSGSSFDGIKLDFIDFDAATEGGGGLNNQAIFNTDLLADATISFRLTENLAVEGALMRLQRTGASGNGSLKLVGTEETASVPEPAATAALGMFALVGMGLMKKKDKVSA